MRTTQLVVLTIISFFVASSGFISFSIDQVQADDVPTFEPQSSDWWNLNWSYSKKITINHSQVADNLTNFPICINITDSDLANKAQSDGDDIAFISADNSTQYHHEIELYNSTSGHLVAWVNITELSGTEDTTMYMYYGNATCNNQENVEDVWDSNFIFVTHMADSSGGIIDSTSNNNDFAEVDNPLYQQSSDIGYGVEFDGSDDYFTDDDNSVWNTIQDNDEITITTYFASDDTSSWNPIISQWKTIGGTEDFAWLAYPKSNSVRFYVDDGSNRYAENTASLVDGTSYIQQHVADDGVVNVYVDNAVGSDDTYSSISDSTLHVMIGASSGARMDGIISEIRVSNIGRSREWITTEYNSMNNATDGNLFSIGDEQTPGNQFTAWEYNRSITFNSSQIPSNLTNFPVCINITDTHIKNNAQADGDDILFTADNVTKLNHEIELYNSTTGHLVAWANITSLSSTEDTVIYMYYGNATCNNQENLSGTWGEFEMVHHMTGNSITTLDDSTSNNNDFTADNSDPGYNQDGFFTGDKSVYLDGSDDEISIPHSTSLFYDASDDFSGVFLCKVSSSDNSGFMLTKRAGGSTDYFNIQHSASTDQFTFQVKASGSADGWGTGSSSISDDTWHVVGFVHESDNIKLYVDGVEVADTSKSVTNGNYGTEKIRFGRKYDGGEDFTGNISEIFYSNSLYTADFMTIFYNSMNNATDGGFFELEPTGPTNTAPNTPTSPQCQNITNPDHLTDHTPYFDWVFSDSDTNDTQHGFQIQVGNDPDWGTVEMWNYQENTANNFTTYNGSSLQDGDTYYWRVRVKDNDSAWSDYTANQQFHMNDLPTAPSLFSPSDNAKNLPYQPDSIELQWTASSDSDDGSLNYWWQYCRFDDFSCSYTNEKDGDEGWGTGNMNVTIPQTTQLYEQTEYYWRVRAWDGTEYGPWSTVRTFETDEIIEMTDLTIPDNATNVSIDTSTWSINITHDDGNPFNWWINTTPDIGNASGFTETDGIKTCQLSGLEYNTTYEVQVLVIGSSRNETYTFTTEEDPDDNIHVTLSPQAEANIEVNRSAWEPNIGITGDIKTDPVWGLLDNNGSITVDVTVNVSNTVNWTAAPTAAHNQFQMQIHNSSWYTIGNTHQTFRENLAYNEDQTFGLQLFMPTSSETNTNQTATITFIATVD